MWEREREREGEFYFEIVVGYDPREWERQGGFDWAGEVESINTLVHSWVRLVSLSWVRLVGVLFG